MNIILLLFLLSATVFPLYPMVKIDNSGAGIKNREKRKINHYNHSFYGGGAGKPWKS